MRAEQFSCIFIIFFCCYLFVSKERKGCNVLIVLFAGSCVSGSS